MFQTNENILGGVGNFLEVTFKISFGNFLKIALYDTSIKERKGRSSQRKRGRLLNILSSSINI